MSFSLPNFNLVCNIWRNGNATTNPPDVVTTGNLANGWRTGTILTGPGPTGAGVGGSWLLLPKTTDIRDGAAPAGADVVEVPALSGRYYDVIWVDDLGLGFANEHRFAAIIKKSPWPVPFPPLPPPPPATYTLMGYELATGNPPMMNFHFPAGPSGGNIQILLFQACVGVTYPTAQIAGGPTLIPQFESSGINFGGVFGTLSYFRTGLAGPGSIIACTGGGNGGMMGCCILWPFPMATFGGGGGNATGATNPAAWASAVPLAGVPATSFAGIGYSDALSMAAWGSPFMPVAPSDLAYSDVNGHPWKFSAAVANYSAITTPSPSVLESSVGAGYAWLAANFDYRH